MKKIIFYLFFLFLLLPSFVNAQAGVPNPAAVYCQNQGGTMKTDGASSNCVFSDVTCEEWAFYRGECGNSHSLCAQHGFERTNKTVNLNGFTASFAVCIDQNGRECVEDDLKAGNCGKDDSTSASYKLNYKNFDNSGSAKPAISSQIWYYIAGGIILLLIVLLLVRRNK